MEASSGKSVGDGERSRGGLFKESPELAAGGVERALLIVGSVRWQRSSEFDHPQERCFHGLLPDGRIVVQLGDELPAQPPRPALKRGSATRESVDYSASSSFNRSSRTEGKKGLARNRTLACLQMAGAFDWPVITRV